MKPFLWLVVGCLSGGCVWAASTNAWERTDAYVAPSFVSYFPDDAPAGARLDDLERSRSLDRLTPEELIAAVRTGLRRSTSPRLSLLRTFGNRLIWGRKPQNADAIELMYHAAGCPTGPGSDLTDYWAVYFGLSVVERKTPNILRTLVELCLRVEQADLLARVEWGVKAQQSECLAYLEPFLNSKEQSVRNKAEIVKRILTGKLNAFEWATEEARKKAETNHRGDLPEIKRILTDGSSPERGQALDKILRDRIGLIMDDSFLSAFAACARDVDARVRNQAVIITGDTWVWSARKQNDEAIQLMLQLSHDPDRRVRYNAVYYGLSTVQNKSEAVLRRLVEMLFKDGENSDIAGRINWGLTFGRRSLPEQVPMIVAEYVTDPDPKIARLAAQWYEAHLQSDAPKSSQSESVPRVWTNAVPEIRKRLLPDFRPFVIRLSDGHALLIRTREALALGEDLIVLVEAKDHVRTVPVRQIAAIEDVPAASPTK
jgi:hypothetical protein